MVNTKTVSLGTKSSSLSDALRQNNSSVVGFGLGFEINYSGRIPNLCFFYHRQFEHKNEKK